MTNDYWDQQNVQFRADDDRQKRMRDLILKPRYYERSHPKTYEFIEHGDPRAHGGVDTIASGKTIDEKIVQWPRFEDGTPKSEPHPCFAFETMSCTVPGRLRDGWMRTNAVSYLLYCFTDLREECLDCHLISFPKLQEWFYAQDHEQWYRWRSQQANETECRLVPITQVCSAIPYRRMHFSRPAHFDDGGRFIHYCNTCGAWGSQSIGLSMLRGRFGEWYCPEHKPAPPPISEPQYVPPQPPAPTQGSLF